jgi:hypothetical protein
MGENLCNQKAKCFEWHKWFKEGHENVEDDERSSCPRFHRTSANVEEGWNLVHSNRHLHIRAMTVQLNLDKGTVTCIEKALNFTMTVLELTRCCQVVSGPKINY